MIFLIITLVALLILGVRVAYAIGISCLLYLAFLTDIRLVALPQRIAAGSDSFILLAVPFFLLAGELMNAGGITHRLVRFAQALIGGIRGGLSYVVVVVNMVMAGVSGAAIADAAAISSVMVPAMEKQGYKRGFAAALNAAAATIGPVIPPSIGFIIYASLTNVSVGQLFMAGAAPGVLMGVYMMIVCYILGRKRNFPRGKEMSRKEIWQSLKGATWALLMPVIILGGIISGMTTPTEAGVLAVIYGLLVGTLVYKQIKWRDVPRMLVTAAKQSAVIMFIIACSDALGWLLTLEGLPQIMLETFGSISDQSWVFMLIIVTIILILGCFMEGASLMIILTPILIPILKSYNIDLIHFGVVFQLAIMVGLLTPPVGMLLFVVSGVGKVPITEILKDLGPFLIALILLLLLLVYFPAISLWLPGLLS